MHMIIPQKTKSTFQSSHLLNSTKTTTGAEKNRQSFTHLTLRIHKTEDRTNFHSIQRLPSVIQVTYGGKLFQMGHGKISKQA